MTYAPEPVRPIMNENDHSPDVCPSDKTPLEDHWSYCPDCGNSVDDMETNKSDFVCTCTNVRMERKRGSETRNETHECLNCGAIWIGLDWCTEEEADRDPDKWDQAKAAAAFSAYMKAYYGVEIQVAA